MFDVRKRVSYEIHTGGIGFSYASDTFPIPQAYLRYTGTPSVAYGFHTVVILFSYINHT